MAKTKTKNILKFLIPVLLVSILFLVVMLFKQNQLQKNTQISQSPLPTIFPDQPVEIPSDWKTQTEKFNDLGISVTFKYPLDWILERHNDGAGYPNYATVFSPDKKQCIGFSISEDYKNIDREIALISTYNTSGWTNTQLPTNSIVSSQNITVDNKQGKIVLVNYKSQEFLVTVVDLNVNKGQGTIFAGLSTCSLNEKQTFYKIVNSIRLK